MKHLQYFSMILFMASSCAMISPAFAEGVGIAGASNPDATGSHPAKPSQLLKLGDTILFKEKITTNASGSLQVSFTDGSGMAIGPNATLIVDEYVFDPNKGAAAMSASLLKGGLRFVGGAISHDKGVNITTPVATIGVRGGIVTLSYSPSSGSLNIIHHFGITTITTKTGMLSVSQSGFQISITRTGQVDQNKIENLAVLSNLMFQTTSNNNQSGGASVPPTSDMITNNIEMNSPAQPSFFNLDLPNLGGEAPGAQQQLCSTEYCSYTYNPY